MSDPQTIREYLEAIKRFNDPVARGWTSDNYTYAVAALDLLDNAPRAGGIRGASTYHSYALVPDPAPRGDAESKTDDRQKCFRYVCDRRLTWCVPQCPHWRGDTHSQREAR